MVLLGDIITFQSGKNSTRIKEGDEVFTNENMYNGLQNNGDCCSDCVISLIRTQAAPITKEDMNKTIPSNFVRCVFDNNVLDPWYFAFIFNCDEDIQRQIERSYQAASLMVKRITTKIIGEIAVDLPDIEIQRKIGELYKISEYRKKLMENYVSTSSKLAIETIKIINKEVKEK